MTSKINNFYWQKFSRVNMKVDKKTKGFTLIEIVVVIAIMGVLTALIYSSFDASRAQSRDQKRVSDISSIQIALEQYFQKNGVYPVQLVDIINPSKGLVPTYMPEIPKDPSTNNDYSADYFPITKTNGTSNCVTYQLWTRFERSNSYLNSKKGFDSSSLPSSLFECGQSGTHDTAKINASDPANTLVYDVMS